MDPDETLDKARKALSAVDHELNVDTQNLDEPASPLAYAAADLCDAFEALDAWLSKGGFLPTAWGKR